MRLPGGVSLLVLAAILLTGCADSPKHLRSVVPEERVDSGVNWKTWPQFVRLYSPVTSAIVMGNVIYVAPADSGYGRAGHPVYHCVLRVTESIRGRVAKGGLFAFWADGAWDDALGVVAFRNRGVPEIGQVWLVFASESLRRSDSPGPPGTFGVIFSPLTVRVHGDESYVGWSNRTISTAALLDTVRAIARQCQPTARDSALMGWIRSGGPE